MRKILGRKDFPNLLKWTAGVVIYGSELPPEDAIYLAVVGAKIPNYGKEACERIIGGLNNKIRQFVIVSGLAIGIGRIAHKAAALKNGLKTIAIPTPG